MVLTKAENSLDSPCLGGSLSTNLPAVDLTAARQS